MTCIYKFYFLKLKCIFSIHQGNPHHASRANTPYRPEASLAHLLLRGKFTPKIRRLHSIGLRFMPIFPNYSNVLNTVSACYLTLEFFRIKREGLVTTMKSFEDNIFTSVNNNIKLEGVTGSKMYSRFNSHIQG